ncbi:MAG TPA: FtsQ-type POTRA domain-containing protein [Smithella sp.]|nr:FtsQ-type POTRA domain-containing protein [Smithella sp.]
MLKRSGLKTKKNRIRRRFGNISGDFLTATGLLFAAVLLFSLFVYAYNFLISMPYFQIKEISVRGLRELTEKDVLTSAGIKPAQNLLAINTDAVIRRVSANQWVENIYVGRELPDKLVLEVKERTPLALVKQGNDFCLMDAEGFVFKKLSKSDEVDLPIITGVDEKEDNKSQLLLGTLNLLKTLSKSSQYAYLGTISEVHVDNVFGLSLIFSTGLYIKLGTGGFENKLKQLKVVLADLESRGMKNGYLCIDLSDDAKVTVQRKNVPERKEEDNKGKQYLI